jgi:hypothetical protein
MQKINYFRIRRSRFNNLSTYVSANFGHNFENFMLTLSNMRIFRIFQFFTSK